MIDPSPHTCTWEGVDSMIVNINIAYYSTAEKLRKNIFVSVFEYTISKKRKV